MHTTKCQNCGKSFSTSRQLVNGRVIRLYPKRKCCLKCVPFGSEYRSVFHKIGKELTCSTCGVKYKYNRRNTLTQCRKCRRKDIKNTVKLEAVKYKGGKCKKCGYNKCLEALTFHHKDPKQKEFNIAKAYRRSPDKIRLELDKCDLLCVRCHTELHAARHMHY